MICNPKSLGAYPDQEHFDPNRSSWLPYWIDTPTESALKWGAYPGVTTMKPLPEPPMPVAPGVPEGTLSKPGVVDPSAVEQMLERSWGAQRAQTEQFFSDRAAEERKRQQERVEDSQWRTWLLVAAGGLLLAMAIPPRR